MKPRIRVKSGVNFWLASPVNDYPLWRELTGYYLEQGCKEVIRIQCSGVGLGKPYIPKNLMVYARCEAIGLN